MNKEIQDKYILDYLEGNLSQSEQNLFIELVSSDSAFKTEYLKWRSTFFLKEQSVIPFKNKPSLKRAWYQGLVLPTTIALLVSLGGLGVWSFYNNQSEIIHKTVTKQVVKHDKKENKVQETVYVEATKSSPRIVKPKHEKLDENKLMISSGTLIDPGSFTQTPYPSKADSFSSPFNTEVSGENTLLNEEEIIVVDELESSPLNLSPDTSLSAVTEKKQVNQKVKRSKYAKKIIRRHKRKDRREDAPNWEEIKEGFKNQRIIPVD